MTDNNIHIGFLLLASLCLGVAMWFAVAEVIKEYRAGRSILNQSFACVGILLAVALTTGLAYIISLAPNNP